MLKSRRFTADKDFTMNKQKFVVSHMDQQMGPFDELELKGLWVKGEILSIDYVYDEPRQDWVLLSERFTWAKVAEVAPPPPIRVDVGVLRRTAQQLSTSATAAAPLPSPAPVPAPVAAAAAPTASVTVVSSAVSAHNTVILDAPGLGDTEPIVLPAKAHGASASDLHDATAKITISPASQATVAIASSVGVAPKIATSSSPPASAVALSGAEVKQVSLIGGFGEIDLSPLAPGKIELMAQDDSASLKLKEPHKIQVTPAEPVQVVWSVPSQIVAGQELEVSLRALDEHGQLCLRYSEPFVIQVRGGVTRDISVVTHDGQASVRLPHTIAESWTLSLHYGGQRKLRLPATQTLEWLPGPPARLVVDGPEEYTAGIPLKIKVKAVDAYGNVAKDYKGTVTLEVKAS